jgi:ubiquinone/menaquinone biosynthesis C-methylase UbiE
MASAPDRSEEAMAEIDWDALSRSIDIFSSEEYTPVLHQFYPWAVDRLDDRDLEPRMILDLGCGTGLLSEKLVDWYPEATLTLVDSNASMLARARERLGDCESVTLIESTAERALAELPDDSVEMMIFCRSWYALANPDAVAARAVEVLAPSGLVFLFDFTRPIDVAQQDAFYGDLEPERWPDCRVLTVDFAEGIREGRYRVYTEEEITAQWRAAGAVLVAYETHEPDYPLHRICFEKT